MGVAMLSGMRSKDPNTCVGACIVSEDNRILTVGYNGMPSGCSDDEFPWERDGDMYNTKYAYVCHAEMNAILNYNGTGLKGSRLYVTLFPCNECTKAIIQKGIREIIYLSDKYSDTPGVMAARRMLKSAGISTRKYENMDYKIELTL